MINNMAANKKHVVSNVLCFLVNKYHCLAAKPLKSLLVDFYSSEELAGAKDILIREIDGLKLEKAPKIVRNRHAKNSKNALDIEDMITALTFLDENQLIAKLPVFTATSPDKMPSTKLVEGDLSLLWSKLTFLEESINVIKDQSSEILKINLNCMRVQSTDSRISNRPSARIDSITEASKRNKPLVPAVSKSTLESSMQLSSDIDNHCPTSSIGTACLLGVHDRI